MGLSVSALKFNQKKSTMYLATLRVQDLKICSIDIYDPKNILGERGYQRKPDEKRIKNIAHYLERKDAIMPVAGLLNIREKNKLKFKDGVLSIPDGTKIWVVDMQHRLKGLAEAYDDGAKGIDDFEFPVVVTEGLSKIDEAAQFYLINTKAKKMDVALTRRLLIENERVADISDVKPWEVAAVIAAIEIEKQKGGPWSGKIRGPNEERLATHIATEKSFVSSLKMIFSDKKKYGDRSARKIAKKMNKVWEGVAESMPEAFSEPKKHLIQRTPGMFVVNYFLGPRILDTCKTDAQLKKAGIKLGKLGSKFWFRKNKNGATKFGTGMGAYARIAAHVAAHSGIKL